MAAESVLSTTDRADLRRAKHLLQNTSLAARIANAVGAPVERFFEALPGGVNDMVLSATHKALNQALDLSISTLGHRHSRRGTAGHKAAVAVTGAIGGAFGLPALAIELPASTIVMLRSIASIAREEGESLDSVEARLACLQVFSFGGPARIDDAAESGYFAVRATLASAISEAAEHLARRGVSQEGAPALVRFIAQVAARFGVPVSEKVVAQSVPLIGAVGGAGINLIFIDHFQSLARGHFIVRRLERTYGAEMVRGAYADV